MPRFMLAHEGFGVAQSQQTLLPGISNIVWTSALDNNKQCTVHQTINCSRPKKNTRFYSDIQWYVCIRSFEHTVVCFNSDIQCLWFGHVERKSGDDWVSACRNVVMVRCAGRGRKTWYECVKDVMVELGLHPEWAVFRDMWRGFISGRTSKP